MAASVASAPLFWKITASAKVLFVNFLANFSPSGIIKELETCQSFFDCLLIAFIKFGFAWPKELTAIPWTKSRNFIPLLVYKKDLFSHLLFALWEFYPGEHK